MSKILARFIIFFLVSCLIAEPHRSYAGSSTMAARSSDGFLSGRLEQEALAASSVVGFHPSGAELSAKMAREISTQLKQHLFIHLIAESLGIEDATHLNQFIDDLIVGGMRLEHIPGDNLLAGKAFPVILKTLRNGGFPQGIGLAHSESHMNQRELRIAKLRENVVDVIIFDQQGDGSWITQKDILRPPYYATNRLSEDNYGEDALVSELAEGPRGPNGNGSAITPIVRIKKTNRSERRAASRPEASIQELFRDLESMNVDEERAVRNLLNAADRSSIYLGQVLYGAAASLAHPQASVRYRARKLVLMLKAHWGKFRLQGTEAVKGPYCVDVLMGTIVRWFFASPSEPPREFQRHFNNLYPNQRPIDLVNGKDWAFRRRARFVKVILKETSPTILFVLVKRLQGISAGQQAPHHPGKRFLDDLLIFTQQLLTNGSQNLSYEKHENRGSKYYKVAA